MENFTSKFPSQLGTMFNRISIGLILLRKDPPEIIFSNDFFKRMASDRESQIFELIFKNLIEFEQKEIYRCDITFNDGFVVGYTAYRLSESEHLVFLNNITHKRIYFNNIEENYFYDRLSNLLAEVVHEIGNPLTALTTTLQVLMEYIAEWDISKKKEYLQRSIDEIDRLSSYLERMRNFSRRVSAQPSTASLCGIVRRVIMQNQDLMEQRHIKVTCNIPDNLMVVVDEELFHQVLLNLVVNSLDSLPPFGKISITLEDANEFFVILAYRNDGPPIPEELMTKIFLPFFTTKQKGSGIGLAVSLKLMTRMGGSLKIEKPEEGWGVKFILIIPVTEVTPFEKQLIIQR